MLQTSCNTSNRRLERFCKTMCSDRPTGWLVTGDRIVVKWDLYQAVGIKNGLILQHQTPLEKSEFCELVIWGELSELHMTTVKTDYL